MGQKVEVSGTGYDLKVGKCLVGGTAYAIKKGRTLKDGTGYDVTLEEPKPLMTYNIKSGAIMNAAIYVNNSNQIAWAHGGQDPSGTYICEPGDTIQLVNYNNGYAGSFQYVVYLNGTLIKREGTIKEVVEVYSFTPVSAFTIVGKTRNDSWSETQYEWYITTS